MHRIRPPRLLPTCLLVLLAGAACDPPPATPQIKIKDGTPEVVRGMIETHGGLAAWASAPSVSFTDEWTDPDGSKSSFAVTVEQSSRRAYLDVPGTGASAVWDGERAWSVGWEVPIPPRFLALLNYYFLNLPWLTQDPGVNLEPTGTGRILDRPTEYETVRMTFDPDVGDTPDDYYVLYIDPATRKLAGCRYVVTYRSLLPEGAAMTPEHLLVYDEWTDVSGLLVPVRFTVYEMDGSFYASCAIRDWSFDKSFDESRMRMPQGAVVDTSSP